MTHSKNLIRAATQSIIWEGESYDKIKTHCGSEFGQTRTHMQLGKGQPNVSAIPASCNFLHFIGYLFIRST